MRKINALLTGTALVAVLAACGEEAPDAASEPSQRQDSAKLTTLHGEGEFTDYRPGTQASAIRYDKKLVPSGAEAEVTLTADSSGVRVELEVSGLLPNREYGAHVHVKECGPTGDDAGPHFQHEEDPKQPSVDPKYANPENEIWLDFTTDDEGEAEQEASVTFTLGDRRPGSVVIHEHHTHTGEGEAGKAGDRLACITLAEH